MDKVDLKKDMRELYNAPKGNPVLVDVPSLTYLMVDGKGYPGTSLEYQEAMEVLYGMAYTLKFMLKGAPSSVNYVVMPLEGLWWVPDMETFSMEGKDDWLWTSMILQPPEVTHGLFEQARGELQRKKGPAAIDLVRLEEYHEGPSAQVMHVGPYSAEEPTIQRLHEFIEEQGRSRRGKHHEIYLSNPRRVSPESMRTIIRQPVE